MAQKAHVPKFGNWDGDNVPYTSYFENARKGKGPSGGKAFNPNDPQENPDAFLSGIFPAEQHEGRRSRDTSSPAEEHEGRKSRDSSSSNNYRRHQNKYGSDDSTDDCDFSQGYMETPPRGTRNHRNGGSSGYTSNRSAETTPELFGGNKKPEESVFRRSASPPPPPQRRPVPKSGRRVDALHETPSSVPRFGAWDDANPDTGDGFTMIFNKVKQEKQIAANKVPIARTPPAVPKVHSSLRSNHAKSSSKPKISCCMLPPTRD